MSTAHFVHTDITEAIIGGFYRVYNELGYGFLEKVYENALAIALRKPGLTVVQQFPIDVYFDGEIVGQYQADLVVNDAVIVELKAARTLSPEHEAQLLNYLKATRYEVGLLLNFGAEKAEVKRKGFQQRAQRLSGVDETIIEIESTNPFYLRNLRPKMTLPTNFQFSQASLADYVDCPRRFQLRYLLEQEWPAVQSEPLLERERLAELGRRFHKLIQQHVEGLPIDVLTRSLSEAELIRWWQSYLISLDTALIDLPADRRAEAALSIPLAGYRLTAHFDLVAADADRAIIVDWKTERRKSTREQLLNRMQTRVYRYALTEAQRRPPGTVSMIYWFAEFPDQPEVLPYDASQHAADHQFLTELISEIQNRALQDDTEWDLTPNERKCDFCAYRSLCNRGVSAGVIDPDGDDLDREFEIKLEAIDEIEY